ncbi:MAG: NUMOD3 domain-containing DNA-binding protein [Candidimonas sp.]
MENIRKKSNEYFEIHHIIPKCLNGTNDKDNLIILTPREHFIAHALLHKMYPHNRRLLNAIMAMRMNKTKNRYFVNSRLYQLLKIKWVISNSGENHHLWNKTHSDEAKKKISQSRKGKIVVKDSDGNTFSVSKDDKRYLNGELVHHSTGKKLSDKEIEILKKRMGGDKNHKYSGYTDDEIINHGIQFYIKNGKLWIKKEWMLYCKSKKIPTFYSRCRFDGDGYNGLIQRIEQKLNEKIKKITVHDYKHKISKSLIERNKRS